MATSSQWGRDTHPSGAAPAPHRTTNSTSSVRSTNSGRGSDRRKTGVESTVTRLLIAIRQLLESLTLWSNEQVSETQVSDVYVRLGNDFNTAVAAFTSYSIDMSDLLSVPSDLRQVLETCLAEDATPANLEIYLPQVRTIITNLLQSLRVKQTHYKNIVDSRRRRGESRVGSPEVSRVSGLPTQPEQDMETTSDHVPEDTRSASQEVQQPQVSDLPITQIPDRHDSLSSIQLSNTAINDGWVGGFSHHRRSSNNEVNTESATPAVSPNNGLSPNHSVNGDDITVIQQAGPSSFVPTQEVADPGMKRYSLTDRPVSIRKTRPDITIDEAPVDQAGPSHYDDSTSAQDAQGSSNDLSSVDASQMPEPAIKSYRALKKGDTLERRASKRFSIYNFQKIAGSRAPGSHRKSILVNGAGLTPQDLSILPEEDEIPRITQQQQPTSETDEPAERLKHHTSTSDQNETSPVPLLPHQHNLSPPTQTETLAPDPVPVTLADARGLPLTGFMQVGREVKRVRLDPDLSLSSLRLLFMDKFSYNPGQDNFPAIYIRDPSTGVQYELEDMEDVKPGCLLSLNIEPLDQIKQHIDAQIAVVSREIRDLKGSIANSNRISSNLVPPQTPVSPTIPTQRPTDKQLRDAARRLSMIHLDETLHPNHGYIKPQITGESITTLSDMGSSRLASDLRTQFDEVQNLRRDLGVMRQMYTQFISQTKESMNGLKTQAQALRQTAEKSVGGARAFVDEGKAKLDARSQSILTKIEEMQDAVEILRDDVVKRNVIPKRAVMKSLKANVDVTRKELESILTQIGNVKPIWKKTWADELQNMVDEQSFLNHVEELVADLMEDHKQLSGVFSELEKFDEMRGASLSSGRSRTFNPPPLEENGINNVMLQIQTAAVDTDRRMKAIEASQKARQRDKENGRGGEFEDELSVFVKGKKLKMTGGAEEIERVRSKKDEANFKAMFSGQR